MNLALFDSLSNPHFILKYVSYLEFLRKYSGNSGALKGS